MAWTSPRTWAAGENLTAALLNTHVRDNLIHLAGTGSGDWADYAPALTNFTGTVNYARFTIIAQTVKVQVKVTLTAAPTSTMLVALPTDHAIGHPTGDNGPVGVAIAEDVGTTRYVGAAFLFGTAPVRAGFASSGVAQWNATAPHTWASGDVLSFTAEYERS